MASAGTPALEDEASRMSRRTVWGAGDVREQGATAMRRRARARVPPLGPLTLVDVAAKHGGRHEPSTLFWAGEWNYGEEFRGLDVHAHGGLELGIVFQGLEEVHFGDHVRQCGPGDVWLCGTWEPHGWRVTADTIGFVTIFAPAFISDTMPAEVPWHRMFAAPPAKRPWVIEGETRERVMAIAQVLHTEVTGKRPFWRRMACLNLASLLIELNRSWKPSVTRRGQDLAKTHLNNLDRVMSAVELVHHDPGRPVSVEAAAEACGLSASRFRQVFRMTMGTSFGDFALRARLAFSAKCLLETDWTIAAIAEKGEFVDSSHLHHAFLKYYGRTPGQFREEGRQPLGMPQPGAALGASAPGLTDEAPDSG